MKLRAKLRWVAKILNPSTPYLWAVALGIIIFLLFQQGKADAQLLDAIDQAVTQIKVDSETQHKLQSEAQQLQIDKLNETVNKLDCLLELHVSGTASPDQIADCELPPPQNTNQTTSQSNTQAPSQEPENGGGNPPSLGEVILNGFNDIMQSVKELMNG